MRASDLDRVIEISQGLHQAPQWPHGAFVAALNPEGAPRRIAFVAESAKAGIVAGFVVASLMPPEAELETIAVASEFQRQGAGLRLFNALSAGLRSEHVSDALLEVRASNYQAQGLYQAVGFVETGRRPRYYADPVEDAVLMRLRIV